MSGAPRTLADLRDRVACRQLAQRVVLAAAEGIRTMMCWQLAPEIADYSDPLNMMDLMFGHLALMDHEDGEIATPRPTGHTYGLVAAELGGLTAVERVVDNDRDVHLYQIRRPGRPDALVGWIRIDDTLAEPSVRRQVTMRWPQNHARITDVFGETDELVVTDGTIELTLSATPVFVTQSPEGP